MAKLIELKGITKSYDGEVILNSINLYIRDGEFITLLGPSGCGKTTTLRIIGGFETADEGELYFDGTEISDVPPHKRQVNTVFQKYALFPQEITHRLSKRDGESRKKALLLIMKEKFSESITA